MQPGPKQKVQVRLKAAAVPETSVPGLSVSTDRAIAVPSRIAIAGAT